MAALKRVDEKVAENKYSCTSKFMYKQKCHNTHTVLIWKYIFINNTKLKSKN